MANPTVRETVEQYQSRFSGTADDLRLAASSLKNGLRLVVQRDASYENYDNGIKHLLEALEHLTSGREALRNMRSLRLQVRNPKKED